MTAPTPPRDATPDHRLQRYLRAAAARGRDVERTGPFLATFDPHTDSRFLNYAIPDDDAHPTAADVAALVTAYERRGRVPRLEYLPAVAPAAEAALRDGGLTLEGRLPVMTCAPGDAAELPAPPGIRLATPTADAEVLALSRAQHAAFGDAPPGPSDVARLRELLTAGGLAVLALDVESGAVVGGAVATPPADGVTELAGIGVTAPYRRRGIAGALTAWLAREAFAAGVVIAFLTPGDAGAHSVYARAGFGDTTEMLHVSRPATSRRR